jgi:hypothetical protein
MTEPEHAASDRQGPPTDAEAHPEQAVDELEEKVLGRQMDQVRDENDETGPGVEQGRDEQGRDEPGPGTEPP